MPWLDPHRDTLLKMAAYPTTHELASAAIAHAEQTIERYTNRVWGSIQPFTSRVFMGAKSYALSLPSDTVLVQTVNGNPVASNITWHITSLGLEAVNDNGQRVAWGPGVWTIVGQRGTADIPLAVIKAASLLVNAYVGLSDAQRSQMAQANRGDMSYAMRYSQLPVPEAEIYLASYVNRVAVEVA